MLRLVRQKITILGREDQAPAISRLTASRAQAIPRHVTSRFGVALCFLNLPNMKRVNLHIMICQNGGNRGSTRKVYNHMVKL